MENNQNEREKVKLLPYYFYTENGRKVMTEQYHLDRGYCCCNGCRHCPYESKAQKGNTTIKK